MLDRIKIQEAVTLANYQFKICLTLPLRVESFINLFDLIHAYVHIDIDALFLRRLCPLCLSLVRFFARPGQLTLWYARCSQSCLTLVPVAFKELTLAAILHVFQALPFRLVTWSLDQWPVQNRQQVNQKIGWVKLTCSGWVQVVATSSLSWHWAA